MSDFQNFEIKIKAVDEASETLVKVKSKLLEINTILKSISNLNLPSGLGQVVKSMGIDNKSLDKTTKKIEDTTKAVKEETKSIEELNKVSKKAAESLVASQEKIKATKKPKKKTQAEELEEIKEEFFKQYPKFEASKFQYGRYEKINKELGQRVPKRSFSEISDVLIRNRLTEQQEKLNAINEKIRQDTGLIDSKPLKSEEPKSESKSEISKVEEETEKANVSMGKLVKTITKINALGTETTQVYEDIKEGMERVVITSDNGNKKIIETNNATEWFIAKGEKVSTVYDKLGNVIETYVEDLDGLKTTYKVINGLEVGRKVTESTKKADKQVEKIRKNASKMHSILKNIQKIILYRAIRRAMSAIFNAFVSGLQNLAKFDKGFNETLSNITTAMDKLKASLSLTFKPIVEALEPTFIRISEVFVTIGNEVSRLQASMKGLSTYTKINSKYAKDYANSLSQANNLLGFDQFNALASQDELYSTADVEEKDDSALEGISETFVLIGEIINDVLKLVAPILNSLVKAINLFISPLVQIIKELVRIVTPILKIIEPIFEPIGKFLGALLETLRIFVPLFRFATELLGLIKYPLEWIGNFLSKIFGFISPIVKVMADFTSKFTSGIFGFANGGIAAPSNIIRTNENGTPEWIGKMGGNTAVVNDTQMTQVMYNAVYNAVNDAMGSGSNISIDFSGLSSNTLAKVLAKPMADQFRKQNIRLNGA